ncbi:CYFA0S03e01200g1_1 [Cyberlindnera fabianii]|uniref:CYFA0S03e01200g1_1 n=1 Tax=Cyberlindnera fabianii TaxID=36022 RepID=A0A061AV17_CYBFA|nr:Glutathione S-transferase 1 [Cyberlindnera fabianii]CDR39238.1 CYFA0S03e01200g1_1 [Cyberlindnera fabianii]
MPSQPEITLYWLESTRCIRILWLLNELGLDYTIVPYDKKGSVMAPKELYQHHPLGKAPILELKYDDERGNITLVESGHIINYMLKWFDLEKKFIPVTEEGERSMDYFLHFAEGTMQPPLTYQFYLTRLIPESKQLPESFRENYAKYQEYIDEVYTFPKLEEYSLYLEKLLREQKEKNGGAEKVYFVEDKLTGADLALGFEAATSLFGNPLYRHITDPKRVPLLASWVKYAVFDRPAYKEAVEAEKSIVDGGFKVLKIDQHGH